MLKKIFISTGAVVVVIIGLSFFYSQKQTEIDAEKCEYLGDGYTYIADSGCVLKEAVKQEREYLEQEIKAKGQGAIIEEGNRDARDADRLASLKNLTIALSIYKEKYGEFPKTLEELSDSTVGYNVQIVERSEAKTPFHYAYKTIQNKIVAYHLGTSLENATSYDSYLAQDADFNSKSANWTGGFDGNDSNKCDPEDMGKFCYDIKSPE